MANKKTIFMDSGSEDEYISYSDEEEQINHSYEIKQPEIKQPIRLTELKESQIKNRERSLSIDSESSDTSKRPNYKCGSCKKIFVLDKNQNIIRCLHCGYRILYKLRTRNHISYKTE